MSAGVRFAMFFSLRMKLHEAPDVASRNTPAETVALPE